MAKIFFDFDGVLVRSRFPDKTFLWQKEVGQALKIPIEVLGRLFQQPEWSDIISGKSDFKKKIEIVFQQHGLSITANEFIQYWLTHDLNWYHDVLGFAARLKREGHDLFIATNQETLRVSCIRARAEIQAVFTEIFASCELGVCKPSPGFFQKIRTEKFNKSEDLFILIDDDQRNTESAQASGWKTLHFNPDLERSHKINHLEAALAQVLTSTSQASSSNK